MRAYRGRPWGAAGTELETETFLVFLSGGCHYTVYRGPGALALCVPLLRLILQQIYEVLLLLFYR